MCTNEYPPAQREQQQAQAQQQQQPKQQQWRDDEEMHEEDGGRNSSSTAQAGFVECLWERKARDLKSDLKSDCLKARGKGRKREYSIFMYS